MTAAAPGRKELELEQEVVKVCTAKLMDNPANAAALVRRGHAYLRQGKTSRRGPLPHRHWKAVMF